MGLDVERIPIKIEELADFNEVGACGTAAVISPIKRIVDDETNVEYTYDTEPGPISTKLYNKLRAIQYGDEADNHNWVSVIEL